VFVKDNHFNHSLILACNCDHHPSMPGPDSNLLKSKIEVQVQGCDGINNDFQQIKWNQWNIEGGRMRKKCLLSASKNNVDILFKLKI
jgi:hypothetical protein